MARERELEREQEDGTHVPRRATFKYREAVVAWLKEIERRNAIGDNMGGGKLHHYRGVARNHLIPDLGEILLTELTSRRIQKWINDKAPEYERTTLSAFRNAMKLSLDIAVDEGWLARNPMKDRPVRLPKKSMEKRKVPQMDDIRAILASLQQRSPMEPEHSYRTRAVAVILATFTGMRRGEICGLQWEDVNFDEGGINICRSLSKFDGMKTPKTKAGFRTVPMNKIVYSALRDQARHYPECVGFVIRNKNGKAVVPDQISSYHWPKVVRHAGLLVDGKPPYTFHDLRHVSGSLWLKENMRLEQVSRLLGHSNISVTADIYAHEMDHDESAIRAIMAVGDEVVEHMRLAGSPLRINAPDRQLPDLRQVITTTDEAEPPLAVTQLKIDVPAQAPDVLDLEPPVSLAEFRLQQRRRVLALHADGVPKRKIAGEVGVSEVSVHNWIREGGSYQPAVIRSGRPKPEDAAAREALRTCARALHDAGLSNPEIVEKTGLALGTVNRWSIEDDWPGRNRTLGAPPKTAG